MIADALEREALPAKRIDMLYLVDSILQVKRNAQDMVLAVPLRLCMQGTRMARAIVRLPLSGLTESKSGPEC